MATDPYYDPTTGLYILAGDNTSKDVTKGINDNFDLIYNRTSASYIKYLGQKTQGGINYSYRVWDIGQGTSNYFCEIWFTITGTTPNVTNITPANLNAQGYYGLDTAAGSVSGDQGIWIYETPRYNYPSFVTFTNIPNENCDVAAGAAVIKTTARRVETENRGYNTTTQTACYGLGRSNPASLLQKEYKLSFYISGYGSFTNPS